MLGATFHLQGLAPMQLVEFHLNKTWLGPKQFPILSNPLFLVHNRVMNNARELHLACFGKISVENQRGVGQLCLTQRIPIMLGDGAGA